MHVNYAISTMFADGALHQMSRNEYHEHPEIHNITISSPEIRVFNSNEHHFWKTGAALKLLVSRVLHQRGYTPHVSQGFYALWCLQLFSISSFFTGRWLVKMPCSKCFHQRFTAILDPHVWHKIGGWQRVMKLNSTMSLNKNRMHGGGCQLWCSDTNS